MLLCWKGLLRPFSAVASFVITLTGDSILTWVKWAPMPAVTTPVPPTLFEAATVF